MRGIERGGGKGKGGGFEGVGREGDPKEAPGLPLGEPKEAPGDPTRPQEVPRDPRMPQEMKFNKNHMNLIVFHEF